MDLKLQGQRRIRYMMQSQEIVTGKGAGHTVTCRWAKLQFRCCEQHHVDRCGATQIQWVVAEKVTGKFPKKVVDVASVSRKCARNKENRQRRRKKIAGKCAASIKVHRKKGNQQKGSPRTIGRQKSDGGQQWPEKSPEKKKRVVEKRKQVTRISVMTRKVHRGP